MTYKNTHICWECEARKLKYSSPLAMFTGLMVDHTITSIAREYGVSRQTIRSMMDHYGYERDHDHGEGPQNSSRKEKKSNGV
jgi:hypothetical protein